ncbi:MAG: S8 family serine peptidase [Rhodospirillales bacterium]|nr:S8 family serine peptidase [Rhodospirillales bacterium]
MRGRSATFKANSPSLAVRWFLRRSSEPIRYHGVLVDLPPERVRELIEHPDVALARLDDIMYLRPQSVASVAEPDEAGEAVAAAAAAAPTGDPIAALLDGVPVANHQRVWPGALSWTIPMTSPHEPQPRSAPGTSMASLILHGDLRAGGAAPRPLYVRPVMIYDAANNAETTPPDRLPLDVVYLAVRRLLEGDGREPASAPTVVVINLSVGDLNRPYAGRISPWARLMDWLSFRYKVLFLISAGNVRRWLPIRNFATTAEWAAATPEQREAAIIAALNSEKAMRSLLSPAEGFNAIAVGAWHADEFAAAPDPFHLKDPFPNGGMPNVSSGVGLGFRQTVKPDVLFDGGRELVRAAEDDGHVWLAVDPGGSYAGQMSAAPDTGATGRLDFQRRTVGSSNATALLTPVGSADLRLR